MYGLHRNFCIRQLHCHRCGVRIMGFCGQIHQAWARRFRRNALEKAAEWRCAQLRYFYLSQIFVIPAEPAGAGSAGMTGK